VVSELARRGLRQETPRVRRAHAFSFPVVEVPPGAPIIPASRVERFLDEEGYI